MSNGTKLDIFAKCYQSVDQKNVDSKKTVFADTYPNLVVLRITPDSDNVRVYHP